LGLQPVYDLVMAGGHAATADEALLQKASWEWAMDSKPQAMTDNRAVPKATVMAADQYLLGMVNDLLPRRRILCPLPVTA
jgi:hypothetical protein